MDHFIFGDLERRNSESQLDQNLVIENPNYGHDVLSKLNTFREEGSFTDVLLCVGKEEFPCHRNVLAVSSPYFKAMFSSDLRESKEQRISFNEISAKTMRQVVDYAYSGKLEISVDSAQEMLAAGSLFQFPTIVAASCEFLQRNLHPSNCLGIENFAQMHSCNKLEMEAHQFTLDNFSAVVEYDEFLELPIERLISYLASDLIDVRTEETVYDAALKWINNDLDDRRRHLCAVLENVRLATIDVHYLEEVVEKDLLVRNEEQCMDMVIDAKRYHETKTDHHGQRRRSMQTETITPRPSTVAKEVMVLVGGINGVFPNHGARREASWLNVVLQCVEMYDPHKDKWHPLPDLPVTVSWYSVSAIGNTMFVSGGILDGQVINNVWKFDTVHREWSQVKPMVKPRARHASAVWNNRLYVLGGVDIVGENRPVQVESLECYDMELDFWSVVGQSPMARKQSRVVPYKQTLVEIGGTQGGVRLKTMESYICSEETLTYSGEQFVLPEAVQFSQIVVLSNIFYIIWEDSKKMISLNPEKRTFRRLSDMHYAHVHAGATVLGGKIYVAGGLVDSKPSRIVEVYDAATNLWTLVKSMKQARACHGCVTVQMC